MNTLRIALIQTRPAGNQSDVTAATAGLVRQAANAGAKVICLQELFNLPYFCRVQDPGLFDLAETIPGPTTESLGALSRELGIFLIVPLFESVHGAVFFNSVAVMGPDGSLVHRYRKMHIPQDPGFEEKFFFAPGDLGWPVFETPWGRIGVLICWDQWYPEAARLMALQGARVIFYPTAIGRLDSEPASLGYQQHQAWETIQRGHAVANGCFVAACNRVGTEGDTHFWGQSFVCDCYGSLIAKGSDTEEQVIMADLNLSELDAFRRIWPFFRDRRIDAYEGISKRVLQ
jgi:N-carbamoylputrescine amidase